MWFDIVLTRDYELQSMKNIEIASKATNKLLESEWKGESPSSVIDKITNVDSKSIDEIVNEVRDGTGALWYKNNKFLFEDGSLKAIL